MPITRTPDPEGDKRRALSHAVRAVERHRDAKRGRMLGVWFASERGASPREIADATGLRIAKVTAIVDRSRRRRPRA
jgi:DNA-binding MarR family transcriptional regulator